MTDTKISTRQFAVKAIHEDHLNVRNPSILAKLLKEYAKNYPGHDLQGCEICERYADIELMFAVGDDGYYCHICYIEANNITECNCKSQSIH